MAKSYHLPPLDLGRERREARQRAHEDTRIVFRVVRYKWLGRVARAVVRWVFR